MNVLDHGYVKLVESWGSDERIVEAARMSTSKGFQGWGTSKTPGDEKLLRYLYRHKHATPFEMAGLIIEVQAPIFVFREWRTHRTQAQLDDMFWDDAYNELSARYTPLPDLNYVPTVERLTMDGGANKQAQSTGRVLHVNEAETFRRDLQNSYVNAETQYQHALYVGVPKELARLCIPVGRYSRMRASANLRNWLAFLELRMAPNAQWEIRQYANAVGEIVAKEFPRTWELFEEGRTQA